MKFVQSIANSEFGRMVFDNIALFFTFFGETVFVMLFMFVIFWCVDKKFGEFLLFCVFTSTGINSSLKRFVSRPRPYFEDSFSQNGLRHLRFNNGLVDTVFDSNSYSFPSGHANTGGGLFLGIATYLKSKKITVICVVFAFMIALSRVYIGVHYPSDVLVGLILGFFIYCGLGSLFIRYYKYKYFFFLGISSLLFILAIIQGYDSLFSLAGAGFGYCVFRPIEEKHVDFQKCKKWWKGILRILVGLISVGVTLPVTIFLPSSFIKDFIMMFMVVGGAVLIAPFAFKKLDI